MPDRLAQMAARVDGLKDVSRGFEKIRHAETMGLKAKYTAIGRDYPFKGVDLLSEERVEDMRQKIESRGLKVDVGK